jgi:threonine/homoserine/homoserine lactone efflux protein
VLLTHVLAFAGAAFLLAMVPGPATAVLLRQTIRHGRRRGVATVAGIEAGVLFWALTAAVGLSALLAASGVAYTVLRIAGTIVLVGLGVQALVRARGEKDLPTDDEVDRNPGVAAELVATEATEPKGSARAFRAGLLTNIANPKAGVFAISFMPQFIPRHEPVLPVSLLLAVVWIICDGTWFLTLTTVVHAARRLLSRGVVRRRLEAASGVALVGFGLRLASQQR